MADSRVSAFDAKTTVADTDMFVLVDEEATPDTTKKITGANMKTQMTSAHAALTLSASVHPNTSLFRGYLSADQANIPAAANWAIRFDSETLDTGNNHDNGDWRGTAAAYVSSDADSSSTKIEDDDAAFTASLNYNYVQWTDSAGENPGSGYITAVAAATLTIVKAIGVDFAASGKYYIQKNYYTVPTAGTYLVLGCTRIGTTEVDKRYATGIQEYDENGAFVTQHVSHNVQASMAAAMTLTWDTIIHLDAGHLLKWLITPVGLAGAYTVAGSAAPFYTWGAIHLLSAD